LTDVLRQLEDGMGERAHGEIFVVDDDPAIREMLSLVLGSAGYEVICFADGAALLAVAKVRCPLCMLLDVHIPGQSGIDILKELRAQDYPAPIFIISGSGDIARRRRRKLCRCIFRDASR
jgi:FixJ family two-component response regulator